MGIKKFKPTSPGRRFMTVETFDEITRQTPERSLVAPLKRTGGRNSYGRITTRHQGGGHKRRYRVIDFKRDKDGVPAKVAHIEYDPNRSARIALLHYLDGEKRYILAPQGLVVGDLVESGPTADIKPGNALPLENIPTGTTIHNVELHPGRGAQLVRSAGTSAQLQAQGAWLSARCACPRASCAACISPAGRPWASWATPTTRTSTAARPGGRRWRGVRPTVRGTAMNPVDHPHGGGEGKTTAGRHPVTPWGVPTLGYRTRPKKKPSDKYIIRGRKRGK